MKKQTLFTIMFSLLLIVGVSETAEAQFGKKAKQALGIGKKGKNKVKKGKGGNKFSSFNEETDEFGITGQYQDLKDGDSYGFRFVKEDGGKMVNELHYFESKASDPDLKLKMKESYHLKHQVKLFFYWLSASASGYIEVIELEPGVFAQIKSDRTINDANEPVPVDATRTVANVYAKDVSAFDTWDIETAQAKVDMIIASLNTANIEKTKKKLLRFEAYKNYVGKIAFAKGTNYLKNMRSNQPTEKVANFITKRELGATVAYKPYFDQPLAVSHPGAWFNVTYEMAGVKTDREALRKSSSVYAKNIPQYDDDQNDFYWQFSKVILDTSNNRADYAFLELLRQAQDKLQEGQVYDLKITVWAHKDGENLEAVASGTIQLEYTKGEKGSDKLLFDPVNGWVTRIENVLE